MKNRVKVWSAAIAAFAGLACNANVVSAAPFTNGSFEASVVNPGAGWSTLNGGSNAISGWVVTGCQVEYMGTFWQASDGVRSVDLDGNCAGGVSQTFDTSVGTQYTVTFDLSGNPAGPPTTKTLSVTAAAVSSNYTFNVSGISYANMGYQAETFIFTAIAAATTLAFTSLDPGFYGPVIDNVRVTAGFSSSEVPAPGAFALILLGFAALGITRPRKATQAF